LVDQEGLRGAIGPVFGFEGGEEIEVGGAVLVGQDGVAGQQAVADGVAARVGLAFGRARPAAQAGVLAVRFDLMPWWVSSGNQKSTRGACGRRAAGGKRLISGRK
jgi:hypothetical protein